MWKQLCVWLALCILSVQSSFAEVVIFNQIGPNSTTTDGNTYYVNQYDDFVPYYVVAAMPFVSPNNLVLTQAMGIGIGIGPPGDRENPRFDLIEWKVHIWSDFDAYVSNPLSGNVSQGSVSAIYAQYGAGTATPYGTLPSYEFAFDLAELQIHLDAGQEYFIGFEALMWGAQAGNFAWMDSDLPGIEGFQVGSNWSNPNWRLASSVGGNGHYAWSLTGAPVPTPGSGLLLGLAGLCAMRRRRTS